MLGLHPNATAAWASLPLHTPHPHGQAGRRSVGDAAYPASPIRRSGALGGPHAREAARRRALMKGRGLADNTGALGCRLGFR